MSNEDLLQEIDTKLKQNEETLKKENFKHFISLCIVALLGFLGTKYTADTTLQSIDKQTAIEKYKINEKYKHEYAQKRYDKEFTEKSTAYREYFTKVDYNKILSYFGNNDLTHKMKVEYHNDIIYSYNKLKYFLADKPDFKKIESAHQSLLGLYFDIYNSYEELNKYEENTPEYKKANEENIDAILNYREKEKFLFIAINKQLKQ